MINRLAKYIDYKHISVRSFEMSIGASDGMIRRAIKNNTDIQCKWLTSIADNFHDISIDWLVTGKGEMLKTSEDSKPANNQDISYLMDKLISQAEEIGRLKELVSQFQQGKGVDVSDADFSDTANVG